jgi:NAD(P)-dependent dehydrogenase (short-subunit alcohol dehydrogenase family)
MGGDNTVEQFRLDGSVAVVTGGAGMLGTQHAEALTDFGAHVVLADLRGQRSISIAARLTAEKGIRCLGLEVDVSDKGSVEFMVQRTLSEFGRLDVLVNNAASTTASPSENYFAAFEEYALADWEQVITVNLTGAFLCCQAVGRPMLKERKGSIVNIASMYGVVSPDQRLYESTSIGQPIPYSVSKAAIIGLTRYLATYWAPKGIRVNAISPGGVFDGHDDLFVERYVARTPLGRMAHRWEMRGALIFLASDASSYCTGHNLIVDGGWTAW